VVTLPGLNPAVDSAFRVTRRHGEIERYLERSRVGVHPSAAQPVPAGLLPLDFRDVPTIVHEDAFSPPMGHQRLAPLDVADHQRRASSGLG